MPTLQCHLFPHSNGQHLQQIYTGFFLLYKNGLIDLRQSICKESQKEGGEESQEYSPAEARHAHLRVILNRRFTLHYDTHDSREIDREYLIDTDYYFKRSYSSQHLQQLGDLGNHRHKVYPLGLNYAVYPNQLDRFSLQRSLALGDGNEGRIKLKPIVRSLALFPHLSFVSRFYAMPALPQPSFAPQILFMVKAWDPDECPDIWGHKATDILQLNDMRANCIALLKQEFGDRFYGGFRPTPYAAKHYPGLLLPPGDRSSKKSYLRRLQSYPIGVATTGLHGSIGWKFAEYVAFAKAIISEPLNFEVPGDFKPDHNYLTFRSPTELVEHTCRLFSDNTLRQAIMTNNAQYYLSHLRPDALVLNSLLTALAASSR